METSSVNIVVAYQDRVTREHAMDICRNLKKMAPQKEDFLVTKLEFNLFEHPKILKEAIAVATEADVIILSLDARQALSPQVDHWFAQWTQNRSKKHGALIALIEPAVGKAKTVKGLLKLLHQSADTTGMEYLCRVVGSPRFVEWSEPALSVEEEAYEDGLLIEA